MSRGRVGWDPTEVVAAGRELCDQGIEAMKGRCVVDAPAGFLVPGAVGGFGQGDGVAGAPSFGRGFVVEQQRRSGPAKMPLQVAGQQAKEQMRGYPAFLGMADRPHPDAASLESSEPAFQVGQPLVNRPGFPESDLLESGHDGRLKQLAEVVCLLLYLRDISDRPEEPSMVVPADPYPAPPIFYVL